MGGRRAAEVHPGRPDTDEDLQCISVKRDNRLFFLSATSKQELEKNHYT